VRRGPGPATALPFARFAVLTWNVCFDEDPWQSARTRAVASALRQHAPAFACLQEVTAPVLAQLLAEPTVKAGFDASCTSLHAGYGSVILAAKSLQCCFSNVALPTQQSRSLVVAEPAVWPGLVVATAHFESQRAARLRAAQLHVAAAALEPFDHALLCGDFNVGRGEEAAIVEALPRFSDVWLALRAGDPGFTFDPRRNAMLAARAGRLRRARFDRVLARLGPALHASSIDLVGLTPIGEDQDGKHILPSDHFGVCAVLDPRGECDERE
jgi:endonuclease/exonuclease/phosphatase family metal-dependent hydrolase